MMNGSPSFAPIFNEGTLYLCILHLGDDDLSEAFASIRNSCARSGNRMAEIKSLLAENGWREHLVATAAILTEEHVSDEVFLGLWEAFDRGSWVSPQLAVVARLRDPEFMHRAQQRIRNGCPQNTKGIDKLSPLEQHVIAGPGSNTERSAKGCAALVYLVGLSSEARDWLASQLAQEETKSLLSQDEDFGGTIAEKWLTTLQSKSGSLNLITE